jgi:hypothetical protein
MATNTTHLTNTSESPAPSRTPANTALWAGIAFSLIFTAIIWWSARLLADVPHLPDTSAAWYYWRLARPDIWATITAWGFYAAHQISIWTLIYYAQRSKLKYSATLHKVNIAALALNAFFITLHLLQTQIWYGALAEDVSIFSSQGSVILLLVMVLLMENQRRGLFLGRKLGFLKEAGQWARKYHGYVFAWAAIYTFWYHPMENTGGHLIGFIYMFLLLLQSSLFFTRAHISRWWTFVLEAAVLVHGTLVAYYQGNGLWPMFAFGFGGIIVITQMFGLGLKAWMKWAILALYIALVLLVYSQVGWARLNEIVRIPLIEYVLVFVLAGLISGGLWIMRRLRGTRGDVSMQEQAA